MGWNGTWVVVTVLSQGVLFRVEKKLGSDQTKQNNTAAATKKVWFSYFAVVVAAGVAVVVVVVVVVVGLLVDVRSVFWTVVPLLALHPRLLRQTAACNLCVFRKF